MAKLSIKPGSENVSLLLFIQDSTSTVGAGKTGLAYNFASLTCYYVRPGSAAAAVSLVTQTVTGAWSSGGFVEIDATNLPGVYRFDVPNAVLAAGVRSVVAMLKGASGMAPVTLEVDLGDDGVKLDATQGAVTFGQVKITTSSVGEGALHIVNSGVAGTGMFVQGQMVGSHNKSTAASGIGQYNQADGSGGYGQANQATAASAVGQYNHGTLADSYGVPDTTTLNAMADAVLKRDWTAVTGEASRSLLNALRFVRNRWSVSGTTLTVTKEDDATTAWTATLSTDAAADPVTGSDPA